jgi:hypothetical protein
MKFSKKSFFGILMMFVFTLAFTVNSTLSAKDFYQLKVYTIKDKAQEASVDKYLEDAYLPAMHRAGVKKVGVFKPIADDQAAGTKIFVFIPIKKMEDIVKLEGKLAKDIAGRGGFENAAVISAVTGAGLDKLNDILWKMVRSDSCPK